MLLSGSRERWGGMAAEKGHQLPSSMRSWQDVSFPATNVGSHREVGLHHLASTSRKTADCGHGTPGAREGEGWQSGKPWGRPSAGSPRLREAAPGCLSLAGNHGQLTLVTSRGDPDRDLGGDEAVPFLPLPAPGRPTS